jgi:phosphate transport system substrate-binding protein
MSCVWKSVGSVVLSAGILGIVVALSGPGQSMGAEVASAAKPYVKVSGISGNLAGIGSDTLQNMMAMWQEDFKKIYPNVTTSYIGKGSGTAPPALIEGTAQVGPMSRQMKDTELDDFEKKYGYKPTRITVALDCVAVFVNKDNPIRGLTIPQVDGIFSSTRNSGSREITTWGQAGLTGEWRNLPISLYGRNSVSGTYAFFKEEALLKGDFKSTVKEQPGSAQVVNAVAKDRGGIGYSGIGYKTADVRAIPLAKDRRAKLAEPTFVNALNGSYPLGRALYIYVNKKPNEPLPPLVAEYLRFVLSREGQQIVIKDGFGPLPPATVKKELARLTADAE